MTTERIHIQGMCREGFAAGNTGARGGVGKPGAADGDGAAVRSKLGLPIVSFEKGRFAGGAGWDGGVGRVFGSRKGLGGAGGRAGSALDDTGGAFGSTAKLPAESLVGASPMTLT